MTGTERKFLSILSCVWSGTQKSPENLPKISSKWSAVYRLLQSSLVLYSFPEVLVLHLRPQQGTFHVKASDRLWFSLPNISLSNNPGFMYGQTSNRGHHLLQMPQRKTNFLVKTLSRIEINDIRKMVAMPLVFDLQGCISPSLATKFSQICPLHGKRSCIYKRSCFTNRKISWCTTKADTNVNLINMIEIMAISKKEG